MYIRNIDKNDFFNIFILCIRNRSCFHQSFGLSLSSATLLSRREIQEKNENFWELGQAISSIEAEA
jgi:hypothetical protein